MISKWIRWLIGRFIVGVVVVGIAGGIYLWWGSKPIGNDHNKQIHVSIAVGSNQWEIATQLKKENVIRDAYLFALYMRFNPESKKIQAGNYTFREGMTWHELLEQMMTGKIQLKEETITIPEGFTLEQIKTRLVKIGFMTDKQFDVAARTLSSTADLALPDATDESKRRLEGYLFPQTYSFPKEAKPIDILERMRDELAHQLRQLPVDWKTHLKASNLTLQDALTIASLIEREVRVPDERAHVSSVIYNRLHAKMPLQIDATIQYTFAQQKERLTFKDLEIDSPYNTYKHTGLPPGPIANPGFEAIKAAIYPDDTKDLFYVTRKDGTNRHYFAPTYAEHRKNIRLSESGSN